MTSPEYPSPETRMFEPLPRMKMDRFFARAKSIDSCKSSILLTRTKKRAFPPTCIVVKGARGTCSNICNAIIYNHHNENRELYQIVKKAGFFFLKFWEKN